MKIFTPNWPAHLGWAIALAAVCQAPRFAAAQTPAAAWQWANRATCTTAPNDYSEGNYIKVDGAGNTFSTGNFHGTLTLGSNSLASPGGDDAFLAKYTPTGAVAWVKHFDGSSSETVVYGLAVDNGGNSYVAGYYYSGTLMIGTTTLTGGGGFLVKYDPQGTALWVRQAGDVFNGLACTAAGEVVAMGSFSGTETFGSTTLTSVAMANSGFLVKYDAQGTALWAKQWEGVSNDAGSAGVDAAGNVYIAADFNGTATFGPITLPGNAGDEDVFVAKYSAAGAPQWAVRQPITGAAAVEHAWNLATDAAGNSYLVGSSELQASGDERFFVAKYTPQGTVGWNYLSNSAPNSGLTGVATDAAGNVYVSGGVAGSLSIGGLTLATAGSTDVNLALLSFTPQGAPRWAISAGTATGTEAALGLALDGSSNLYVTGVLEGNTALGSVPLPQNSAAEEQFVAKVSVGTATATARARTIEPLQVSPNPATGTTVSVRWSALLAGPGQLQVRDARGRLVRTYPLPAGCAEAALPANGLAPGVYSLHLQTGAATALGRLVVE